MHDWPASMENPGYRALWQKTLEGFRAISGKDWETRADYPHFWPLVRHLYGLVYGPRRDLPDALKGPLAFMFAGHAGRRRKGIRARPYFHHVLMVVFLAWLLDLPEDHQKAAICHDDVEDIPENLGVDTAWVQAMLRPMIGEAALASVHNLTNVDHAAGKHAGQMAKMVMIPPLDATLKLLDRIANLFDMRLDKPKGFGPARIRAECANALDLALAMPRPAAEPVLALLTFSIAMLASDNDIEPPWIRSSERALAGNEVGESTGQRRA